MTKKNEKRKAQILEKNMEQLLSYLLIEDGIHDLKEGTPDTP